MGSTTIKNAPAAKFGAAVATSAEQAALISDETGTGALVFATDATLTRPAISAGTGSFVTATVTTLTAPTANVTNLDAGTAAGVAGTIDIFPASAGNKGKLSITAAASDGNTTTTIVNASQAAGRTYTIPDAGGNASFVMSTGVSPTGTFTAASVTTLTAPTIIGKDIDLGNATGAGGAGSLDLFSATTTTGKLTFAATANTGNHIVSITNAEHAQPCAYTIPDAGEAASFLMTKGTASTMATVAAGTITTLTATNIDAGAAATAGSVDIFAGGTKGKLTFSATESTGNTVTTITNALQADTRTYTIPDAGESTTFLMAKGTSATMPTVTAGTITTLTSPTIIGNAIDLGLAAGGTAGSLDLFSATGSKGKLTFAATANTGDSITTITNAAQGGAYTYSIPDAGEPASFVMTKGTVTVATLTAGKATNIVGGAGGTIPYQSSADTTGLLANGTAGQILTSQGGTLAPVWGNPTLNGCVVVKASLGSPAVSVATAVATAQAVGAPGDLTLDGTLTADGVATFITARNIQAVSTGAGDLAQTLHIHGTNIAGAAMSETVTLNGVAVVYGKKAFKTITSIAVSALCVGNVSVGNSTKLGLPYMLTSRSDLATTWFNNVQEVTLPTVALGDSAAVSAITGDTRGTVILNSTLDGSPVSVYMTVYPLNAATLYGAVEYST